MVAYDSSLLSVVVATYNAARYLAAALASVAAQPYRPLEIIVIDDGSTDETPAIVDAFFQRTGLPGHYRYQRNQGPAGARNHGLALARGAWIAFQDADDLWLPGKTPHQMKVLVEHPNAGAVWGSAIVFRDDAVPALTCAEAGAATMTLCLLQSMLFRRATVERVGEFDPSLRIGEDLDWLFRALERTVQIVIDHELVVYYRRHATNLTSDIASSRHAFHQVLKCSLDRRRRQGMAAVPSSLLILPRQAFPPRSVG